MSCIQTPVWHFLGFAMIARTFALFVALLALLNLLGDLLWPGFDANIWWISFRLLPVWLGKAVLAVRGGDVWLERGVLSGTLIRLVQAQGARPPAREPLPADFRSALTARESEIVAFVAEGLTNKEVARRLCVSHETIKKHLKKVFVKLGVRHRTEVILHCG